MYFYNMKQVTLHIPDNNYPFFIELAKSLAFVKKIEEVKDSSKQEVIQKAADKDEFNVTFKNLGQIISKNDDYLTTTVELRLKKAGATWGSVLNLWQISGCKS